MTKLYGYVSNMGAPEYDDIINSDLPKEEKVKQINMRGQAYRDEIDRQSMLDNARIGLGGLVSAASMHPILNIPYIGTGLGGAMYELGQGMVEGDKLPEIAKRTGQGFLVGETVGALPYVGKLAGKTKAGQYVGEQATNLANKLAENPIVLRGARNLQNALAQDVKLGVNPFKTESATLYNFIGENAFNAPRGKLMEAKQMAMYGDSNADIRNATGWFQGVDGKWRYEIPDGRLIENPNIWETKNTGFDEYQISKLGDIYDNPELYQAYPKLKDLSILKSDLPDGVGGISTPNSIHIDNSLYSKHNPDYYEQLNKLKQTPEVKRMDEIVNEAVKNGYSEKLDNEYNNILSNTENGKLYNSLVFKHNIPQKVEGWNDDALNTFVHEIQHQIQAIEGFARGGNSSLNPNYKNLAGEVEARLAGARAKLTPEQRQIYNPANESSYLTNYGYDVIPEKQIIEYKSTPANSLNYRNEWVKIDGKDYRILNLPKKDYGKILHIVDTYLKPEDMIGEVIDWSDDLYKYTFQKVSPTDYKFIRRRKLK